MNQGGEETQHDDHIELSTLEEKKLSKVAEMMKKAKGTLHHIAHNELFHDHTHKIEDVVSWWFQTKFIF